MITISEFAPKLLIIFLQQYTSTVHFKFISYLYESNSNINISLVSLLQISNK